MIEWTIDRNDEGARLDPWLARRSEASSRGRARAWLERGKVFVNGDAVSSSGSGRSFRERDRVGLWIDRPGTSHPRRRNRLRGWPSESCSNANLLVADKPAGLLVEPLPRDAAGEVTLVDLVADRLRPRVRTRPLVVHRIKIVTPAAWCCSR